MIVETFAPIGASISDVDLRDLGVAAVPELIDVLAVHGVVVFRDQGLEDEQFLAFLTAFGQPVFTAGETAVDGFPDLNVVSNVGRATPPRSVFHTDTSYIAHPPAYTALRAVDVPREGGHTLFTNQYRAYESLADDVRGGLRGRLVRHAEAGTDQHADHPLFRVHPVSGRTSLYISTPTRCVSVSGLPMDESEAVIAELYAHSVRDENVHRHEWRAGDVVMWDNGVVLHKADHSGVVGERVLHRGMVDGYARV